MPSVSKQQFKFFKAMENNPEEAKKKGISQSLAQEYTDNMTKDRWKHLELNKKQQGYANGGIVQPNYSDAEDYPADPRLPQNLNISGNNVINSAKQAASDLSMGILNSQKVPGEFEPGGGGISSISSPIDYAAPLAGKALGTIGSEAITAAPRMLGNEVGSIGPGTADLIAQKAAQEEPSLADQIRAMASKNPVKVIPSEYDLQREAFQKQFQNAPSFWGKHGAQSPKNQIADMPKDKFKELSDLLNKK